MIVAGGAVSYSVGCVLSPQVSLDASAPHPPTSHSSKQYPQAVPNVSLGGKIAWVENHWSKCFNWLNHQDWILGEMEGNRITSCLHSSAKKGYFKPLEIRLTEDTTQLSKNVKCEVVCFTRCTQLQPLRGKESKFTFGSIFRSLCYSSSLSLPVTYTYKLCFAILQIHLASPFVPRTMLCSLPFYFTSFWMTFACF